MSRCAKSILRRFGAPPHADSIEDAVQEFWGLARERACRVWDADSRLTHEAVCLLMQACGRIARGRRRHLPLGEEFANEVAAPSMDPLEACIRAEVIAGVQAILSTMPAGERALLMEHHGLGVKIADIAHRQERTCNAVCMALHAARRRFRDRHTQGVKAESGVD